MRIEPVTSEHLADLDDLFGSDGVVDRCWCMWFLIRVADFHEAGRDGNRSRFVGMVESEPHPMGLIAYDDERPVGWCALGPRERFARAVKTPTMRRRRGADDEVWFIPCFFVRPGHRNSGVASSLLTAAVEHALAAGAVAVEGFPLAGSARRSAGSDLMTGVEPLFESAGFEVDHRPSNNRVIMRRTPS